MKHEDCPKVTVIVPVYKAELFFERCLRSLFGQTLEDMEFIFVDDASPDCSMEVLDHVLQEYPSRMEQVQRVSLPENRGTSYARTVGIRKARGEFVIHCDSDDWVDADLYARMYEQARMCGADIVMCDVAKEMQRRTVYTVYPDIGCSARDAIRKIWNKYFDLYLHNKLIRRSLLVEHEILPFPEIRSVWEDNGMMCRVFFYAETVAQLHGVYYHYNRCNENALTRQFVSQRVDDMIMCATLLARFFSDKEGFEMTVRFFQFCAKINLIMDRFDGVKRFYSVFPKVERYAGLFDKRAFSRAGRVRLFFVGCHLSYVFVFLLKLYKRVSSCRK